jgi:excisionase family DNA binding protein
MAGRFLTLEETARQLGVTADEVNRLVDRKKLFPMRDGATVKFKADDVERAARDLGDDASHSDDLALDLDLPAAGAAAEDLSIGDSLHGTESIFSAEPPAARGGSQTIVRGGADGGPGLALDGDDLSLESIIAASSPALGSGAAAGGSAAVSGLTIDLGDLDDPAGGSGGLGSAAGASGAGAALSGALDSGLSLEERDMQISGIDVGGTSAIAGSGVSIAGDTSGLGGDAFELGGDTADDESASVVIATEETGDSSFFGAAIEGEGSTFSEDVDSASVVLTDALPGEYSFEMPFSGLQIAGLICCSLLLLAGGFVMFDLVRTIGSNEGPSLANPLLDAMADTFGWR